MDNVINRGVRRVPSAVLWDGGSSGRTSSWGEIQWPLHTMWVSRLDARLQVLRPALEPGPTLLPTQPRTRKSDL